MIEDFEPLARGDQDSYMGQMLFPSLPRGRLPMLGSYTHRPRTEYGLGKCAKESLHVHRSPKTAQQESFSPKLQPEIKRAHFWRTLFPYAPQEPTRRSRSWVFWALANSISFSLSTLGKTKDP